jgi:hypothetical protein
VVVLDPGGSREIC